MIRRYFIVISISLLAVLVSGTALADGSEATTSNGEGKVAPTAEKEDKETTTTKEKTETVTKHKDGSVSKTVRTKEVKKTKWKKKGKKRKKRAKRKHLGQCVLNYLKSPFMPSKDWLGFKGWLGAMIAFIAFGFFCRPMRYLCWRAGGPTILFLIGYIFIGCDHCDKWLWNWGIWHGALDIYKSLAGTAILTGFIWLVYRDSYYDWKYRSEDTSSVWVFITAAALGGILNGNVCSNSNTEHAPWIISVVLGIASFIYYLAKGRRV